MTVVMLFHPLQECNNPRWDECFTFDPVVEFQSLYAQVWQRGLMEMLLFTFWVFHRFMVEMFSMVAVPFHWPGWVCSHLGGN